MRITEDFETREHNKNGWIVYFPHDVEQLLAHARSLEAQNEGLKAMIKRHAWVYDEDAREYHCVECRGVEPRHDPDCALAKLIMEE